MSNEKLNDTGAIVIRDTMIWSVGFIFWKRCIPWSDDDEHIYPPLLFR